MKKVCDDEKYENAETNETQEELSIGTQLAPKNCNSRRWSGGSLGFFLSWIRQTSILLLMFWWYE